MVPIEPVSLTIGAVSLAALFSLCVECFDLIELGKNLGADYELLSVKLSIEKRRLMIWGEAVGILRPDGDRDPLLDDPETYQLVERILMNVQKVFNDADALRSKYGLETASGSATLNTTADGSSACSNTFEGSPFVQFQRRIATFHRKTGLLNKTKWAIRDSSKFTKMVEHLRDLHDGLGQITTSPRTNILKNQLVRLETQSIPDLSMLNIIEETCSDADWKSSASAASLYLQNASYISPAKRSYIDKWVKVDVDPQRNEDDMPPVETDWFAQPQRAPISFGPERSRELAIARPDSQNQIQKPPKLKHLNRPFLNDTEIMIVCSSGALIAWVPRQRDDVVFSPATDIPEPTPANRMTYSRIMKAIHIPPHHSSVAIYCPPRMQFVHLALCFVQEQLATFGELRFECNIRFDDRLLDKDSNFDNIPDRMKGYYKDLENFAESADLRAQPLVDAVDMSWLEQRIDVVTLPHWRPLSEQLDWSTIFRQSKDDIYCIGIIIIAGEEACQTMLNAPPVTPPDIFRGNGRVYRLRELDGSTVDSTWAWKAEHHCNIAVDKDFESVTGIGRNEAWDTRWRSY